jgi:hypothetical protein
VIYLTQSWLPKSIRVTVLEARTFTAYLLLGLRRFGLSSFGAASKRACARFCLGCGRPEDIYSS